jgi:linear primary-alkylsulfatase
VGRRPGPPPSPPPAESAKRFVALVGADAILAPGPPSDRGGRLPLAAEILHKLVFADPDNTEARQLQADAYEQMGYQAEGPQWRASS